jgi:hypothetical protein
MRTTLSAWAIAVLMIIGIVSGTASAEPSVVCDDPSDPRSCTIVADSPGSPGGDTPPPESGTADGGNSAADDRANSVNETSSAVAPRGAVTPARSVNSTECDWRAFVPGPPAGDPRWGGADPATNTVIFNNCNGPTRYAVRPNGAAIPAAPVAPPPPDPAVLAQQAIGQLKVPKPGIHLGPDPDKIAVNFYAWLWLDAAPPVSSTVALAGVSVTATATLSSVNWSMGEPLSLDGGGVGSVTCQGPGVAPSTNADFREPPPCGYMFKYRSLLERTNGVGKWPVAATATWSVSWTASTGQTGADSLSASSTTNVEVGEYRTTRGTGG